MKAYISATYIEKISNYINTNNKNYKYKSIEQCLSTYNNAFVLWRYSFEEEYQSESLPVAWIELYILTNVLRDYILEKTNISFD